MSEKTKEELRDWFAGQALSGLCAIDAMTGPDNAFIARFAYNVADAMMAERAKTQEGGE